jgi:nucleoside 2-deoxyribosyltransferase
LRLEIRSWREESRERLLLFSNLQFPISSIIAHMKIYFSGSISGGRDHAAIYQHLVAYLQALGHAVLSAHVADPAMLEREKDTPPRVVFERDVAWVHDCDVMIAEVSTPSLGVGYEYGLAVQLGKPVLCVYRSGLRMSKMITGNPAPHLTVHTYSTEPELDQILATFLDAIILRSTRESHGSTD